MWEVIIHDLNSTAIHVEFKASMNIYNLCAGNQLSISIFNVELIIYINNRDQDKYGKLGTL